MPWINLPEKKKRVDKRLIHSSKKDNLNHSAVYNTSIWKELRIEYLKEHPTCERCLKNDKITLAIDVHHIIPISAGKTKKDKQIIGFDWNNLMALCKDCHKEIHKE